MRRALCLVALALPLMGHPSCDHEHYVVELRPEGEALNRVVTVRHHASDGDLAVDPQTHMRLSIHYPEAKSEPGATAPRFEGRWTQATPQDVGGAGRFLHLAGPMGRTSAYAERFRGDPDQAGHLAKGRAAVDRFVDLMLRWFDHELAKSPRRAAVHALLGQKIRGDLHNLLLLGYAADMFQDDGDAVARIGVRAVLYLHERGYIPTGRLPQVVSAVTRARDDDSRALLREVRRVLAGEATGELPELAFLASGASAEAALEAFLKTTPEYAALVARWKAGATREPAAPAPRPMAVMEEVDGGFIKEALGGKTARIAVELATPVEPFLHNGAWDAKARRVRWVDGPMRDAPALPRLMFASWSQPDTAFQTRHFGRVVASGEALAEYLIWRAGLTPAERSAWDAALAKVEPGSHDVIAGFRFATETATKSALSDQARRLLLPGPRPPGASPPR